MSMSMSVSTTATPSVIHKQGACTDRPANPALTFPYEPDHFQNHAFNAMERGDHVLVTAHTGSGKTTVAEYAIAYGIASGKRVIYTAPIKALSNQIFGDLSRKYPHWSLGIRTGDIDYRSEQAQVVIMTTEILLNMLYRADNCLEDVSVVIFDEVHYIKDSERGSVWERSIIMIPDHVQMVLLSATLPDADDFCSWIAKCKGRNVTHTTTSHRTIPLTHSILTPKGKVTIMDKDGNFSADNYTRAWRQYSFIRSELDYYLERGVVQYPALFFTFSKRHCELYAKQITVSVVSPDESGTIQHQFERLIRVFANHTELVSLSQTKEVQRLCSRGICYHHAGLLPPLKEIVQELFSQGLIKILFVTETFAAGVNMPAKTVVFTGFKKYDNHTGFRTLLPEEYGQMSGRAGRRGMDTEGHVIHLPFDRAHHPSMDDVRYMMCGAVSNIEPRADLSYHHVFNCISYGKPILLADTLMARKNSVRLEYCRQQLLLLDAEYKRLSHDQQEFDTEFADRVARYRAYHNGSITPAERCAYKTSGTDEWYKVNKSKCRKYTETQGRMQVVLTESGQCLDEIDYLVGGETGELTKLLTYLYNMKYIDRPEAQCVLTVRGTMASLINEANPIMLTELVMDGYLDDLDVDELICVLSIFLPSKESDRECRAPLRVYNRLVSITRYVDTLSQQEADSPCASDRCVYREFCDMSYYWSKYGNIDRMYAETESTVHIGEFVRMMIKLNNICKEVQKATETCQRDELSVKLSECQSRIIRGVVCPQSMYVAVSK